MDVGQHNFQSYLPWLLKELTQSFFVAIDFEFSGIALASPRGDHGVGLTFCSKDTENGVYQIKPFNINLSPIVDQALKINREWTVSSASIDYLLGHGLGIDALCKEGVHYLTHREEQEARETFDLNSERIFTWEPRGRVPESLKFRRAAHAVIDAWIFRGRSPRILRMPPFTAKYNLPGYLNYQQRNLLVTMVGIDYPNLQASACDGYVQVQETGTDANSGRLQIQKEQAEQIILKGIGFRWVADALIGGDLTSLPSASFADLFTQPTDFILEELASALKQHLKDNRAVLVGHNCFTDLIFFYHHFIGKLPDTIGEFQVLFHRMFPLVIDTKYLYTSYSGCSNARSSLPEACKMMASLTVPTINNAYGKYLWHESLHEAGYDSMLTAILFLKLSVQLRLRKEITVPRGAMGSLLCMQLQVAHDQLYDAQEFFNSLVNARSKQAQSNPIDLMDFAEGDDVKSCSFSLEDSLHFPVETEGTVAGKVRNGELVPPLTENFWSVYGNKLRMFGMYEEIIDLSVARETGNMN
ncbi:hypothetical protein N7448_008653 [Penicillium atrosanguineum]|uniref:Uncharacterized protein n=1 Tax=Penicillium atrosanguineum TaxID=1132637 RepID=A0A9W9QCV9_9EURO|nr:uncharacterized protein N7443_000324 [Penicillium atrosanguineum]KAJ5127874.1 hypothetical protein N7448_008653 [Penicillium atrosanguineum]KAJ5148082.1 hypothetical protein N7526_001434 [Penicillium atrosanguineum]KAJ5313440.1 hypothetical protein N7443_000324 [Penicillium atrosanguineum]KAJ5330624.1 hypothetical protein N7476_000407 [Penicillium atrosanguineum]